MNTASTRNFTCLWRIDDFQAFLEFSGASVIVCWRAKLRPAETVIRNGDNAASKLQSEK